MQQKKQNVGVFFFTLVFLCSIAGAMGQPNLTAEIVQDHLVPGEYIIKFTDGAMNSHTAQELALDIVNATNTELARQASSSESAEYSESTGKERDLVQIEFFDSIESMNLAKITGVNKSVLNTVMLTLSHRNDVVYIEQNMMIPSNKETIKRKADPNTNAWWRPSVRLGNGPATYNPTWTGLGTEILIFERCAPLQNRILQFFGGRGAWVGDLDAYCTSNDSEALADRQHAEQVGIAAAGNNLGIAQDALVTYVQVGATQWDFADSVDRILSLPPQGGQVANISLGFNGCTRTVTDAVQMLLDYNILVVAAMDNDGYSCGHSSNCIVSMNGVLGVGSVHENGNYIGFNAYSGAGSCVDISSWGIHGNSLTAPDIAGIAAMWLDSATVPLDVPRQDLHNAILNTATTGLIDPNTLRGSANRLAWIPRPGTDIGITSIDAPELITRNDSFTVTFQTNNTGLSDPDEQEYRVVLTKNEGTVSSDDLVLQDWFTTPVSHTLHSVSGSIPQDFKDGEMYIHVDLRPANGVADIDNSNNIRWVPVEVGSLCENPGDCTELRITNSSNFCWTLQAGTWNHVHFAPIGIDAVSGNNVSVPPHDMTIALYEDNTEESWIMDLETIRYSISSTQQTHHYRFWVPESFEGRYVSIGLKLDSSYEIIQPRENQVVMLFDCYSPIPGPHDEGPPTNINFYEENQVIYGTFDREPGYAGNYKVIVTRGGAGPIVHTSSAYTAFAWNGYESNSDYYFAISASNPHGSGNGFSNLFHVQTGNAPRVTGLEASLRDSTIPGQVRLDWDNAGAGITYSIERQIGEETPQIIAENVNTNSFTDQTPHWDFINSYRVRTHLDDQWSTPASGAPRLPAPTDVSATTEVSDRITLTWTSPSPYPGLTSYIWRKLDSNWHVIDTVVSTQTQITYEDLGVNLDADYLYRIQTTHALMTDYEIRGRAMSQVFQIPTGLIASVNDPGRAGIYVEWDSLGAGVRYGLRRATSLSGPFTQINSNMLYPHMLDSNTIPGQDYYYQVNADDGPFSSIVAHGVRYDGSTQAPPAATSLTAEVQRSRGGGNQVSINWEHIEHAEGYRLYRAMGSPNATKELIYEVVRTNSPRGSDRHRLDFPSANGVYYYWVTGYNNVSEGPFGVNASVNYVE